MVCAWLRAALAIQPANCIGMRWLNELVGAEVDTARPTPGGVSPGQHLRSHPPALSRSPLHCRVEHFVPSQLGL